MAVRYDWQCDTCHTTYEQTYPMATKPTALECPLDDCAGTCRSIIDKGEVIFAGGQEDFHDRNLDSELKHAESEAHAGADYFRQQALAQANQFEQRGATAEAVKQRRDFADRHHRDTVRRADKGIYI